MKIQTLVLTHSIAPMFVAGALLFSACSTSKYDVSANDKPRAAQGDHPAMTPQQEADMKVCMEAGMPGPMHALLTKGTGMWKGTSKMWMGPEGEPMTSEAACTKTSEFDGRFAKVEYTGDMGEMGQFHGIGYYGFDNVAQKFVASWFTNCGSGLMNGEGTLGADGKTITWIYTYNCPIVKGRTTMREIESHPTEDTMTIESYMKDPRSGKEFKAMQLEVKRQPRG